jgi:hypothetical protein
VRKTRVFVDGEKVRAFAEGSTVYIEFKSAGGGKRRIAVRPSDLRRVLRGQPHDASTARIAASLLRGRSIELSNVQSPNQHESRDLRRQRRMKVTLEWVLNEDVANLKRDEKNSPKKGEWDAWTMTKALRALKDAEEKDYISTIEEVSETQLVFKPRGLEEGGRFRDRDKPASAKDERLGEAIEAILGLGFVFKIVKVRFGE